jgi:hypothetical protein
MENKVKINSSLITMIQVLLTLSYPIYLVVVFALALEFVSPFGILILLYPILCLAFNWILLAKKAYGDRLNQVLCVLGIIFSVIDLLVAGGFAFVISQLIL